MQQHLILIWHSNSLACPHVFLSLQWSAGQQASEDWQLSQAEVYWPACWWLGLLTITDTKPLFQASRTPQLRVDTLCSQPLSMWTPYLHSLCVKKAKAHYQDSWAQVAFWSFEDIAITSALQTCASTFHSIQISADIRPSPCTAQDKRRLLHLSLVTTAIHLSAFVPLFWSF